MKPAAIMRMRPAAGGGGGGGGSVVGGNRSSYGSATAPNDAEALANFNSDGTVSGGLSGGNWLTSGSASSYDLYVYAPSSGTFTTGTTGTALNLGTTHLFSRNHTSNLGGSSAVVANYEIRNAGTSTVVASGTLTLTAEVFT